MAGAGGRDDIGSFGCQWLVVTIASGADPDPAAAETDLWPEPYDYPSVPAEALPPGKVVPDPAEEAPPALLEDGVADLPGDAVGEA
jgi:hypothetical protein